MVEKESTSKQNEMIETVV